MNYGEIDKGGLHKMRKYNIETLELLRKNEKILNEDGVDIVVKANPESNEKGILDIRVYERTKSKMLETNDENIGDDYFNIESTPFSELRSQMGSDNINITEREINITQKLIKIKDHLINIYIYNRESNIIDRAAVVFLHGGCFFGGNPKDRDNQCRLLAEKSGAVVIAPEYRLAPENPYPDGLEDCYGTVEWTYNNHEILNFNKNKLVVAGDSAGGNYAAVCGIKDANHMIKLQLLIYPVLDLTLPKNSFYKWDYSYYDIAKKHEKYIKYRINKFKNLASIINLLYTQNGEELDNTQLSPIYLNDFTNIPKMVIYEAEFDYYRICNDTFAKIANKKGAAIKVVRYQGMDHGFFDRIGSVPQTEDCIIEMSNEINGL